MLSHLPDVPRPREPCAELRLRRIGVLDRPLDELSGAKRAALVAEAYGGKLLGGLGSLARDCRCACCRWPKKKRLTDTYLRDPHVTGYQLPEARVRRPTPSAAGADALGGDCGCRRRT